MFRHFSWSHWQFSPHASFPLRHLHCLLTQRPLHAHWKKKKKEHVASIIFPCNHKEFTGLTRPSPDPTLTPTAFVFFEVLRHFSGFSGRHSSSSWSCSSSLGDISSSMLMAAVSGALAVVKRFALGFSEKGNSTKHKEMKWRLYLRSLESSCKALFQIKFIKRILFTESVILCVMLPFGFNTGLE